MDELAGAVVSTVVIWGLNRWWARDDRAFAGSELRHSRLFFWLGAVVAVPATAGAVRFALENDWAFAGVAAGLALLGFYAVWEALFVRFSFSEDSFSWRTLRAGRGAAPWTELESLGWEKRNRLLALNFRGRPAVRISSFILGLDPFARFLLVKAAHANVAPPARRVLSLCADGKRPDNWDDL